MVICSDPHRYRSPPPCPPLKPFYIATTVSAAADRHSQRWGRAEKEAEMGRRWWRRTWPRGWCLSIPSRSNLSDSRLLVWPLFHHLFLYSAWLASIRLSSLDVLIHEPILSPWPWNMELSWRLFVEGVILTIVCGDYLSKSKFVGPYDVRVRMKAVGICGSDVHYLKVRFAYRILAILVWEDNDLDESSDVPSQLVWELQTLRCAHFVVKEPMVIGHECAGVIEEVGSEVKSLVVGDRVALEPGISCWRCKYCKGGRYNLCPDMKFFATPPVHGSLANQVLKLRFYPKYSICAKINRERSCNSN